MLSIMAKLNFFLRSNFGDYLGILALKGKKVKGDDDSAIKEHLSCCNHGPDFSILATNNNNFKITLKQSFLINRDYPSLNKNK